VGAVQAATVLSAPVLGKARAVRWSRLRTEGGLSAGRTESINAAVAATWGAEKLVPSS
jgi:hypothetical protein